MSCGNVPNVLSDQIVYHTEVIPQDTYIFALLHSHLANFDVCALTVWVGVSGDEVQ